MEDVIFEGKLKAYKIKNKIISQISDSILEGYPEYDFFDITLTPEFCGLEKIISLLVDKAASGKLERDAYAKYCDHMNREYENELP